MSTDNSRVLLDENVERRAMRYLEKRGHDIEMVVNVLGPGSADDEIVRHAADTGRLVLTSDPDFLSRDPPTLFLENDKLSAFEVAEIVDAVAAAMSQTQVEAVGGAKLVDDWM
jgi:predicted nuclease of predicted toxin-antitoxin system